MSFQNMTFDDRDTTHLAYQGGWFLQGTYNASSVGDSGTLASTNDVNANVTFTFPVPAVAFYYFGIKRSRGGLYAICIDCDPNARNFIPIDAVNATDDGRNPPVVLFSQTFQQPGIHEIILKNQLDPRNANGNSQITLDRFVLEVPGTAGSTRSGTPTTVSETSSKPVSTTEVVASLTPTATPAPSKAVPIGPIIGGALGGVGVLLLFAGILLICHRRRKRRNDTESESHQPPADYQPSMPSFTVPSSRVAMETPVSTSSYFGHSTMPSTSTTTWTTTSAPTTSVPSRQSRRSRRRAGNAPRRERDAGRVHVASTDEGATSEDDDLRTLPPEYDELVFDSNNESTIDPTSPRSGRTAARPASSAEGSVSARSAMSGREERRRHGDSRDHRRQKRREAALSGLS